MNRALHAWKGFSFTLFLEEISESIYSTVSSLATNFIDTVEHLILLCVLYTIICIVLYLAICKWDILQFNREPRNAKRILFVIAHPDDECMFFGPTVLHYTRRKNSLVYLLCLSTGQLHSPMDYTCPLSRVIAVINLIIASFIQKFY